MSIASNFDRGNVRHEGTGTRLRRNSSYFLGLISTLTQPVRTPGFFEPINSGGYKCSRRIGKFDRDDWIRTSSRPLPATVRTCSGTQMEYMTRERGIGPGLVSLSRVRPVTILSKLPANKKESKNGVRNWTVYCKLSSCEKTISNKAEENSNSRKGDV